jgi:arylsulfatase A
MTIDLLPTLASICGGKTPSHAIDGKDLTNIVTGDPLIRNDAPYFFYWGRELQAVRQGKWKLHFAHDYPAILEPGKDGKPGKAEVRRTEQALFDLETDIGESRNVALANRDVVARLLSLADQKRKELGDSARKMEGNGVRQPGKEAPSK